MNSLRVGLSVIFIMMFMIGCNQKETGQKAVHQEPIELTVSAAISLTDALEEIKKVYEKERDQQVQLTFNLGGSGTLSQQIQQGAPVDVFISANQQWMDTLEEKELIRSESRRDVTGNQIVLIAGVSSSTEYDSFDQLNGVAVDKVAIGNPESVPAGKYTEEVLQELNKWDELEDQFVFAKDVRQVLTYVETGNADIGFVYESDAFTSDLVKVLAIVDAHLHEPIIYPGAVTKKTKYEEEAKAFLQFMETEEAQHILETYGFAK